MKVQIENITWRPDAIKMMMNDTLEASEYGDTIDAGSIERLTHFAFDFHVVDEFVEHKPLYNNIFHRQKVEQRICNIEVTYQSTYCMTISEEDIEIHGSMREAIEAFLFVEKPFTSHIYWS